MPGLMSLRKQVMEDKPLRGAKIIGCTAITAPTAVSYEIISISFSDNLSSKIIFLGIN